MSEEILQRGLNKDVEKIGTWDFYNIGATTLKALKKYKIILNQDYGKLENRKPDGLIVSGQKVLGVVENKNILAFKTQKDKNKAIQQGLEVAKVLGAKLVIATDSKETVWVNALNGQDILDEKDRQIKTNFDLKNPEIPKLIERILDCITENNSKLIEPRLKDPTKLAKSVWQDLWSVSGATPENCLYTFVELFIFKYLSDLGVLKGRLNYDFLMNLFNEESAEEVLSYYADTIRKKVKELFPAGEDGTTIINGTIFVSKDENAVEGYGTVFEKILKKFGNENEGGGELTNIDKDFKSKLFETFLKESISKKNWGQFFTPLKVVKAMVKMAESEIKPGISICDPACGVGKFLLEPLIIKDNIEDYFPIKYEGKKKILDPQIELWGIDKGFDKEEQKTIILAKANMLIYLSDLLRKHSDITDQFANYFNNSFELKTKNILGTLRDPVRDRFDLILANPPYVTSGSSNLKDEIAKNGELSEYYKINAMGVEGLFMEWIIRALKPGGKAFIVVPDGIFNRQNDKHLRQFILDECYIDGVISLPLNTFFTTPQKTYILAITKKQNKTEIQKDPVFTYLVSEIGESRDTYRFNIEQNNLEDAKNLFNAFKNSKEYFIDNNTNPRCKFKRFSYFVDNFEKPNAWSVDKFWSKEEKIKLGVVEVVKKVSLHELPSLIDTTSSYINSFKDEALKLKNDSQLKFKEVKLVDIFEIKSGNSKLTKSYIDKNKGEYVVYSANTKENGIFGYIKTFDFETECIQITTNGVYAGTVFYREKHKFSINGDARLLLKKDETLDYQYLLYELRNAFAEHNFNWQNKPTVAKTKDVLLSIPIDSRGLFDLQAQKKISEKYKFVEEMKSELKNQIDIILKTEIKI